MFMPNTLSMAGLPVAREYPNSPKDCHAHGPAMVNTVERAAPGASFPSVAPSSVSPKVSLPFCVRTPKLASVRMKRCNARGLMPGGTGKVGRGFRALGKMVSQTEFRCGVDECRQPVRRAHSDHFDMRRDCGVRVAHFSAACLRWQHYHTQAQRIRRGATVLCSSPRAASGRDRAAEGRVTWLVQNTYNQSSSVGRRTPGENLMRPLRGVML